jgi:hypothetical protein
VRRSPAGTSLGSHQQVHRQAWIDRLGLGQDPHDVDVVGRLDLLLEDLARVCVIGRVADDPAPRHGLLQGSMDDYVDPVHRARRQRPAMPTGLRLTRRPLGTPSLMRLARPAGAPPLLTARPVVGGFVMGWDQGASV